MTLERWMVNNRRNPTLFDVVEKTFKIKLNPIQEEAVALIQRTDDNIIVSAPTGSGKTIIGYSALLHHGKGFYLAPLISLMMEKYGELNKILGDKYKVMVSNRDYRIPTSKFLQADFKILSPYKFLTLFNEIDKNVHGKVIVVDEIHKMSNDPLFEATITLAKRKGFRIIGLSATLTETDINKLSNWLNAKIVRSSKRPVKLTHTYIKVRTKGSSLIADENYTFNGKPLLSIGDSFYSREELAGYIGLRIHIETGKPVIIWSPTRNKVERIAKIVANSLGENPKYTSVVKALPASNTSERLLKFTASRGVFIHHGGLSATARDIVERAYKELGGIIVTAYTLSHGVNIPGTYIIFSTIYDWRGELINPSVFHQVAGRAGRPGFDNYGVAITLVIDDAEEAYYNTMLLMTHASEIEPKLLFSPYNAVKMLLPVVNRSNISEAIEVLKDSFSYFKNPSDEKVKEIMNILEDTVNFYKAVGGRESWVAMDMGLHPYEYNIIKIALSRKYEEALPEIIDIASTIHGIKVSRVYNDIMKFGFLAIWMGNPQSRVVANTIQTTLESGVYFASRVYGWKSGEREKIMRMAKIFTYAGNPRVEPLSKAVRIDTLRRMIKAVPQIVEGERKEEAVNATIVAVKEAFHFWKKVPYKNAIKIAKLVWYAITGETNLPDNLVSRIKQEVVR